MAYGYCEDEMSEPTNCVPCQELVITIHKPSEIEQAIQAVFRSDRELRWSLLEPKVRADAGGVMTVLEGKNDIGDITKVVTLLTK